MRVAFVGGVGRLEAPLTALGSERGIAIEVHEGDVRGRGSEALAGVVGRADHVFVVTGTNSHGGVRLAKQYARRTGARVWVVRSFGLSIARRVVEELATHGESGLRAIARAA